MVPGRVVPAAAVRVRQDHVDRRARRVRWRPATVDLDRRRLGIALGIALGARRADHAAARPRDRAGTRRDHDGHASRRRRRASSHRRARAARAGRRGCDPADRHAEAVPARPVDRVRRSRPARHAYQQTQSKIAIGAGGVTGQGFFKGTQTNGSVRARAAHRLHLHRGRGAARASSAPATSCCAATRCIALADLAHRARWRRDQFGTLICVGRAGHAGRSRSSRTSA